MKFTIPAEVLSRFWKKVQKGSPNECWMWTGALSGPANDRRPMFRFEGKQQYAHRVAWIIANGEIPKGLKVLHTCDNPPCVNPNHLWLGTIQDNSDDMVRKGRHRSCDGEKNGRSRLTELAVKWMRAIHFQNGASIRSIAKRFGVSKNTAWSAINHKTWKHVTYLCPQP